MSIHSRYGGRHFYNGGDLAAYPLVRLRGSVNSNLLIGHRGQLPNIYGTFALGAVGPDSSVVGYCGGTGAFRNSNSTSGPVVGVKSGEYTTSRGWVFEAASYNSIYKTGALPEAVSVTSRCWLRLA